jgi:thioesterase domain-containing protein
VLPSDAAERVHCLPGIGGLAAFTYQPLAGALVADCRMLGYQLPGAVDGERPQLSLRRAAEIMADRVDANRGEGRIHLLGYSYGGLLAVEIAAILAHRGRRVGALVVLDAAPPRFGRRFQSLRRAVMERLGLTQANYGMQKAGRLAGFRMNDGSALGEVESRLRAVMRATQLSLAFYRPCRIEFPLDVVMSAPGQEGLDDDFDAWRRVARHVRFVQSPGAHTTFVRREGVATIAGVLREAFARRDG